MNTDNPFAALTPSPAPFAGNTHHAEIEEADTSSFLFSALKIGTTVSLAQPTSSDPPAKSRLFAIHNLTKVFVAGVPNGLVLGSTSILQKCLDEASMNAGPQQLPESSEVVHLAIPNSNFSFVDFTSQGTCIVAYDLSSQEIVVFNTTSCLEGNVSPRWKTQLPNLDFVLPNPEIDDLVALHLTTQELCILSISQATIHPPIAREATCVAWSRRGKQCAVGFLNGSIVQYTPDGQAKQEIAAPSDLQDFYVQDIAWMENREFIVYYSPITALASSEPVHESVCYIISLGIDKSITYAVATDPTPPFGADYRHDHHYFSLLQSWHPNLRSLVIVSATSSSDIGLFAHMADSNSWKSLVITEETKRASLPYSQAREQDTSPLSLSLDLTSTERIEKPLSPVEVPADCPPLPILWVYDNDYQLSGFRFMYTDAIMENSLYPEMVVAKSVSGTETVRTSNNENVSSFASLSEPPKFGSQMSFGAFQTQKPAQASAFGQSQGSPFTAPSATPKFGESSFSFNFNTTPANNAFTPNNSFAGFGTKSTSSAFSSFASALTPANLSNVPKDNEASNIFGNAKVPEKQPSVFQFNPVEKAEPEKDMENEKVGTLANADVEPSTTDDKAGNSNINWGSGLFGKAAQPSFSFGLSLNDKTPNENFSVFGAKSKDTTAPSTDQASTKPFSFAPPDKSVFTSSIKPTTPASNAPELPRSESVSMESLTEKPEQKDNTVEVLERYTLNVSLENKETDEKHAEATVDEGLLASDNVETEKANSIDKRDIQNDRQSPFIEELKDDDTDEIALEAQKESVTDTMPKESVLETEDKLLDTELSEEENLLRTVSHETNESDDWEKVEGEEDFDEAATTKPEDFHEETPEVSAAAEEKLTEKEADKESSIDKDAKKQISKNEPSDSYSEDINKEDVAEKEPEPERQGVPSLKGKVSEGAFDLPSAEERSIIASDLKEPEESVVSEAPKLLEKKPVPLETLDLLEDMQEIVSTESNPMVNAFENLYLHFEAEMDLVTRNMEKLVNYVNDQSNTGYSNDIYPNMTCLPNDTQTLESLLDEMNLWTSGKTEYDKKLETLRVTLVRLSAKRVQIQRLVNAHTDPVFINRLKLRQLGPEALRRQKELRVSMEKIQKLMTSVENMAFDVRLSDVQNRKRLSLASIEVACSRVATVLAQRERELLKLEVEVKGLFGSNPNGPFIMDDLSSSLISSLEKGSDSLFGLREGSRSSAKTEVQRQDEFCDIIFNSLLLLRKSI
ncbi:nucleoporin Nup146 [Schizosaccharomyces cryophilus OY26]|uniref:Nucleoporin Nup146 n=1 Tax=Schizosaccharomyces cryophilus (strain OY26 / ATCC MYA-4695 / CBS 11777 / NBRC 106824 / NRRL Y48691) TaxID=653667 RepID=S9X4F4_SCHCR|nr:nucleoporin Nup146 [Schizosaccharomyces cryophilus OY26]EPY51952.1 nucleoporin Nup146 [Schizosaccharomyces cryophilus OY26]